MIQLEHVGAGLSGVLHQEVGCKVIFLRGYSVIEKFVFIEYWQESSKLKNLRSGNLYTRKKLL